MRLIQTTINNSTYHVKIGLMMTNNFKVGNGLQKGAGLAPTLFNITLEYVMRQQSVEVNSTTFYKSVQLVDYADDVNIIGRTKRAVSEVYEEPKKRIKAESKKIVQNRRTRKICEIFAKVMTSKLLLTYLLHGVESFLRS
jgi:hypothetical protein